VEIFINTDILEKTVKQLKDIRDLKIFRSYENIDYLIEVLEGAIKNGKENLKLEEKYLKDMEEQHK
jgi:hypothetical protein